jgi:hypothetical protein
LLYKIYLKAYQGTNLMEKVDVFPRENDSVLV